MIAWLLLLSAAYPLGRAWQATRGTTLLHAGNWLLGAWAVWAAALLAAVAVRGTAAGSLDYMALCLTGCAAVAVLGARRPGVGAWNFVVLGLLAIDLLPVAEGWGRPRLDWPRVVFLGGTLAIGVLNYLPTRIAAGVICVAIGLAVELAVLASPAGDTGGLTRLATVTRCLLAVGPWAALVQVRVSHPGWSEFDRLWLGFRDRFGLVWAQRTREQFNRAAAHAGWPVLLRWGGLRLLAGTAPLDPEVQVEIVATLRNLLKRFCPEDV
jgi:hypothetical protein